MTRDMGKTQQAAQGTRITVKRLLGNLAGAPGFEPGNGGTKNRCLTAWLHPNYYLRLGETVDHW